MCAYYFFLVKVCRNGQWRSKVLKCSSSIFASILGHPGFRVLSFLNLVIAVISQVCINLRFQNHEKWRHCNHSFVKMSHSCPKKYKMNLQPRGCNHRMGLWQYFRTDKVGLYIGKYFCYCYEKWKGTHLLTESPPVAFVEPPPDNHF